MYFVGDVHGEWARLARLIREADVHDQAIVSVGDFGIGFHDRRKTAEANRLTEHRALAPLRERLKDSDCRLHVVRGNHDDPSRFSGAPWESSPFITLHHDYTLVELEGQRLLMIGGAHSVDRAWRADGVSWWRDESFVLDEQRLRRTLEGVDRVDIVITHSAPTFCHPRSKSGLERWSQLDDRIVADCERERDELSELHELLRPYRPHTWYYGHFHESVDEVHDSTRFRLLAELELVSHEHR